MPKFKLLNNITGWLVFIIASVVYISTIEATASFWDCGEYISCADKLEVGHPPGAPFFLLIGRFFILLGGDNPATAGKWVNIMSALCSSFTILFLYFSITRLAQKIVRYTKQEFNSGKQLAIIFSGVIGALAYTFSDSFWFSAVEGEVYAMSSLFTAVAFWAILKWEEEADSPSSVRWLIFIAFIMGLSIGVHLLNLLVIPAICFIFYFRKYTFTKAGFILTGIISIALLGGIQSLMIPKIVKFSADFELFFTNKAGMSFGKGTLIYFGLMLGSIILGILYAVKKTNKLFSAFIAVSGIFVLIVIISGANLYSTGSVLGRIIILGGMLTGFFFLKNKPHILHHILVSTLVLLLGYSTFFVLVIRSQANTPMDENNPENAISLLSYLNRDQYGDWPILYGQAYNAQLDPDDKYKKVDPLYAKDTVSGKYIIIDDRKEEVPNYDKEHCTFFPRMWSSQSHHISFYETYRTSSADQAPNFSENMHFFMSYQVNYMFWRYFGWNFIGRQNELHGQANNSLHGNVLTGFKSLDKKILGIDPENVPTEGINNKATNKFYLLPLILGLIGLLFHLLRNPKDFFVTLMLFFFTGLAIVLYLNQTPYQPRERDYAYTGAFYAFAIWIGLGVLGIAEFLTKWTSQSISSAIAFAASAVVPWIMGQQGWDDHDRSNRTVARDFAINYLQSCEKNAVLFTNGDNDTFPLWYAQEVEGIRTDVRVVNLSLLSGDWCIDQARRAAYESAPLPFSLAPSTYAASKRNAVYFRDAGIGRQDAKDVMNFIGLENGENQFDYQGSSLYYFPTQDLSISVDSASVVKQKGLIAPGLENRIPKRLDWKMDKNYIIKSDMMVLDLIAHADWKRPIYFAVTTDDESLLGLKDYLQLEGLAWRLTPVKSTPEEMEHSGIRVYADKMYDNFINKFQFGGLKIPGINAEENTRGQASGIRYQISLLATQLVKEGKKDKAEKVLDKIMLEIPDAAVPLDGPTVNFALTYLQIGKLEKAKALAKRLREILRHDIAAYSSLPVESQDAYIKKLEQCEGLLNMLKAIPE